MDANRNQTAPSFEIVRTFAAPLDRVWKAWSERSQLEKWWGPKGCALAVLRLEFRPGGFFHYSMRFGNAGAMWGRFNYREIEPMRRIVWLNSFANEGCGIARAPFSDLCPLEIENTATFEERDGTTTVTMRSEPFGCTAEEVEFFAQLCASGSIEKGTSGTLDQLEEHLRAEAG